MAEMEGVEKAVEKAEVGREVEMVGVARVAAVTG